MDDVVPEAESLLHHPLNLGGDEGEVSEEREENPESAGSQDGEERGSGGFTINHLISNLVGKGDADEKKQDNQQAEKEKVAIPEPEEKGGGLLDHIISSLVTPSSPRAAGKATQEKGEAFDVRSGNESEGGGGSSGGGDQGLIKKEEMVKKGGEEENAEPAEGSGGGIINNIVSHLPSSLPGDAAPTTDEATILIHIVQD